MRENFSLTPRGIIESLKLRRPFTARPPRSATSAAPKKPSLGSTDKAAALRAAAGETSELEATPS